MSIAAVVVGVVEDDDPRLILGPIRKGDGPGQPVLHVVNRPCPPLRGLIGTMLWGGSTGILCGETVIAERIGYTRIRLLTQTVKRNNQ